MKTVNTLIFIFLLNLTSLFSAENKMVRSDRVWELSGMFYDWNNSAEYMGNYVYVTKYNKFGDLEIIDGNTYYPVINFKKILQRGDNSFVEFRNDINYTQARLREEEGKVYMHIDKDMRYVSLYSAPDLKEKYGLLKEGLLFDFNATPGESYIGLTMDGIDNWYDFQGCYLEYGFVRYFVKQIEQIEIKGKLYNIQILEAFELENNTKCGECKVLEGVGVISSGGMYYLKTCMGYTGIYYFNKFNRYFDINGELLYGEEIKKEDPYDYPYSKIEIINSDKITGTEREFKYFDLYGKEVKNPVPGEILLRTNGIKSEKIVFK